ncbi:CBS domain-containing protein [Streptomyces sp. NBC_01224]|nr:CBS domain-containing protein [Streptomyces sp. NBC_01224]
MSHPAITAAPEWSAVRVMEQHKVKGLPAVDSEGQLIGVLSRSDLVQLFLRRDHAIQEEILEDVLTHTLRLSPSSLTPHGPVGPHRGLSGPSRPRAGGVMVKRAGCHPPKKGRRCPRQNPPRSGPRFSPGANKRLSAARQQSATRPHSSGNLP